MNDEQRELRNTRYRNRTCSFIPCGREVRSSGLCEAHYYQKRRGVELKKLRQDVPVRERFEKFIDINGPVNPKTATRCHLWIGAGDVYGQFSVNGTLWWAHRLAWELYVGPIPEGHEIDHDDDQIGCCTKKCVNVDHLKPTLTNDRRKSINTSGAWGVFWRPSRGKWTVTIKVDGKKHYPSEIGLPTLFAGDPPPAKAPRDAVEARDKLRAHLGLPE